MTDVALAKRGGWWKRHWVVAITVTALVYLAAGSCLIGAYYANSQQQAETAADQYRAYAERTILCDGIETPVERYACLAEAVHAEQQRLYSAANLHTQQDMSMWGFVALWLNLGLLVVTGVGVTYVALTLDQTKLATDAAVLAAEAAEHTAETTRNIGQKQLRAFITIKAEPRGTLSVDKGEAKIDFLITVGNVGKSIAKDVRVFLKQYTIGEIDQVDQVGVSTEDGQHGARTSLVPEQQETFHLRWTSGSLPLPEPNFYPVIAVRVEYGIDGCSARRFSTACFAAYHGTDDEGLPAFKKDDLPVKRERIYVQLERSNAD